MAQSKSSARDKDQAEKKNTRSRTKRADTKSTRSKKSEPVPPPPPPPPPIRRELTGGVFLLLAIFVVISYFNMDGAVIAYFRNFLSGLIGWGYWLAAPALLAAAVVLLFHGGKPVTLRAFSLLMLPVLFGGIAHLLRCPVPEEFEITQAVGELFLGGQMLTTGGVIGGLLAMGMEMALSIYGALPILLVVFCLFVFIGFKISPSALVGKAREYRPRRYEPEAYEEEPEDETERLMSRVRERPAISEKPREKAPRKTERVSRPAFSVDVPLGEDEEPLLLRDAGNKVPEPYVSEAKTPKRARVRKKQSVPEPQIYTESAYEPDDDFSPEEIEGFREVPIPGRVTPAKAAVPVSGEIADPPKPKKLSREELAEETKAVEQAVAAAGEQTEYEFPPLDLLRAGSGGTVDAREEIYANRERLEGALRSFGVNSAIVGVTRGPTVTRYDIELEQGVKLAKVTNLSGDLALALGVVNVRIAPIPGKMSTLGIEVPNKIVSTVYLRDIIESPKFANAKSRLSFAIGKDIGGESVVGNIAKLPHMLIAGTTGSGKSVCMNSLILSLLYKARPDEVRLIMIDPKMVELGIYNGIPHLYVPVVTDPKKAAGALQWSVVEMLKRYRQFSEIGVRDLEAYNRHCVENGEPTMPQVVIVIDELADLMLVASKDVEESICRVAQMGRAAGMHLVIATQRPSADVITGLMKANIPSRIAFAVSSSLESRIILDQVGAEKLVGMGDMLFSPVGSGKPTRIQGAFVSDEERENVIQFIKESAGSAPGNSEIEEYMNKAVEDKASADSSKNAKEEDNALGDYDPVLPQAAEVVLEMGSCSTSSLQRRMKLGYSRAARIVDQLEELGIVGPYEGAKPRAVIVDRQGWHDIQVQLGLVAADDMALAADMSQAADQYDFEE